MPIKIGFNVRVECRIIGHDVLTQAIRPGVIISSGKFDALLFEWILELIYTSDSLTEFVRHPIHGGLSILVGGHNHVANLIVSLADDSADLTHILNLLDLVLNHELACLNESVEPHRIQPKRSNDGHEQLGKVIELTNQGSEGKQVIRSPIDEFNRAHHHWHIHSCDFDNAEDIFFILMIARFVLNTDTTSISAGNATRG